MRIQKGKRVCKCIVALCLLAISLSWLTDVVERKNSRFKYAPFFEQEENFDILFLGTSHEYNSILPMELWNDYGIVSYNFGGDSNELAVSYWVMQNALNYTTPKLIVVDGLKLSSNTKIFREFNWIHISMDAFPLNFTKMAAVFDLLDDDEMEKKIRAGEVEDAAERTKISLLWDFSVYHSRWNELSANDFVADHTKEKGAVARTEISIPDEMISIPDDNKLEGETTGVRYLRKIIEECHKRNIDVLLTYLPFPASAEEQMEANRLYDIAQEYGINYINYLDMDLVDYHTDCADSNSHLNASGARKVTDYLGQYISDNYDIPDQRKNTDYSTWYEDYNAYKEFKVERMKQQESLDSYLMLLADKNYDIFIEMMDSAICHNTYYAGLLENLGIDVEKITEDVDGIFVRGAERRADYLRSFHTSGDAYPTSAGNFEWRPSQIGGGILMLC